VHFEGVSVNISVCWVHNKLIWGAREELEAVRKENQALSQRTSQLRDDLTTMTQVHTSLSLSPTASNYTVIHSAK